MEAVGSLCWETLESVESRDALIPKDEVARQPQRPMEARLYGCGGTEKALRMLPGACPSLPKMFYSPGSERLHTS